MNLIQLCEFVDIDIICFSGFALLLDPLWKMPYHFFQIFSLGCEKRHMGNPVSSKIVLIVLIWPQVPEKILLISNSRQCPLAT